MINATGIFTDHVRQMDEPGSKSILTVSQGTHVVLPRHFLPGESALMVPRTADGRVLFAIPWHESVVVGTTDDPVSKPELEPRSMPDERTFLLDHIEKYLGRKPEPSEIRSVWSGQRPLVRKEGSGSTAAISRDHTILISPSKLVTVTGGKWTTYRRMAQDTIDRAAPIAKLKAVESRTPELRLHGWLEHNQAAPEWQHVYGAIFRLSKALEREDHEFSHRLHGRLPMKKAEVVWAARNEMARSVEDVLARRTRALFLDAQASIEAAPDTARLMARELGCGDEWVQEQVQEFTKVAEGYVWR